MVAVNTRTLLAISLASLSLVPSADSLAIKTPSSSSSSPSKQARQQQPRTAPMPMKLATKDTGKHKKLGGPVKGNNHKSRVVGGDSQLGETVSRRQQARFDVNRVTRGHFEARQDPQMPGQAGTIAIMSPNGNSSDSTTNGTVLGHLFLSLSNTTTPSYVLDASQNNSTTFFMVPSNNSRVTLQLAFDVDNNATARRAIVPFCATYNPDPPAPQPLTMEECGNPSTAGGSQQFQFNNGTGILQPLWYTSNNGTATAPNVNDDSAADSDSDDDTLNSRDVSPQNVNLVFVPIAAPGQAAEEEVSPSSAAQIDTVTVTVTSTASSLAGSASPMTDSSSQSASYPPDRVISTTSSSSAAAASFAAADVDVASSSTYITSSPAASSPTGSFLVSTTSSDLAPSFAAAQVDAVSSTSMAVPSMPTSSSDDSAASTVGALDVEVGSSSSMDGPTSSTFVTGTPSSSSASGAPSASTSVDAATIAAEIANGGTSSSYPATSLSSGSASSSASSPSSSADVVVPPTTDSEQAVYVENPAPRAEMMAMRTEPYQWKFSPEPRL